MATIVHVATEIVVRLGVLDESGNVKPMKPLAVSLYEFSAEEFAAAYKLLAEARDKAKESGNA